MSHRDFSVEEAILEKSRLEALQQVAPLNEEDKAMLSILSQWLEHYERRHSN